MHKKHVIPPAPTQSRGAKAKESLTLVALVLFGGQGFQATSTRDIAKKAGQNIAAIPYYFGNKEGLYIAALEKGLQLCPQITENMQQAELALEPTASVDACLMAITQWVQSAAQLLAADNPYTLSFMKLVSREQISPTTVFTKSFEKIFAPTNDVFVRLVGRYLGLDANERETKLIAHALMGPFHSFRMMPEFVLQHIGIKKMGKEEVTVISEVIVEQVQTALRGMRAKRVSHA